MTRTAEKLGIERSHPTASSRPTGSLLPSRSLCGARILGARRAGPDVGGGVPQTTLSRNPRHHRARHEMLVAGFGISQKTGLGSGAPPPRRPRRLHERPSIEHRYR
jgi:hypothetical protein